MNDLVSFTNGRKMALIQPAVVHDLPQGADNDQVLEAVRALLSQQLPVNSGPNIQDIVALLREVGPGETITITIKQGD